MEPRRFAQNACTHLLKAGINTAGFPPGYVGAALETAREKGRLFKDLAPFVDFFFLPDNHVSLDPEAVAKALGDPQRAALARLRDAYSSLTDFTAASLESTLKSVAADLGVKAGALTQPARVACTGRLVGPSLYHLIEILGRDRTLARFNRVLTPA
jgi:glutamyl-tRNA synthetase